MPNRIALFAMCLLLLGACVVTPEGSDSSSGDMSSDPSDPQDMSDSGDVGVTPGQDAGDIGSAPRLVLEERLESLLELTAVPGGAVGEQYQLIVQDPEIASASGRMLQTKMPGTTTVSLLDASGSVVDSVEVEVFFDLEQIEVGREFACVRSSTGRTFCWGNNNFGQLSGDFIEDGGGPTYDTRWREVPGTYSMIEAGRDNACGIASDTGELFCWGRGDQNIAGIDNLPPVVTPRKIQINAPVQDVTIGWQHACAIDADGLLFCWGDNADGEIAQPNREAVFPPTQVLNPTEEGVLYAQVSAGDDHTCAATTTRRLHCWGDTVDGQLGIGEGSQDSSVDEIIYSEPQRVNLTNVEMVVTGHEHTCALVGDPMGRELWCWGRDLNGVVGDGPGNDGALLATPVKIEIMGSAATSLDTEDDHTCILREDGSPSCWGEGANGRLGTGRSRDEPAPGPVAFQGNPVLVDIGVGFQQTCAIESGAPDQVYCWGRDGAGLLGPDFEDLPGRDDDSLSPYPLQMPWVYWHSTER